MAAKDALKSFVAGLVMILILVVTVPLIIDHFVQRYIEDIIGDAFFLSLSSEVVVNLLIWMVVIGLTLLLGAGGILKRFGVIGIIGLIVTYWILCDVTDVIISIGTLAVVLVVSKIVQMRKSKKIGQQGLNALRRNGVYTCIFYIV